MSLLTPFLKLFKWDTTNETDLNSEFNVDKSMNDNWDKLDAKAQEYDNLITNIEDNISDIQDKNTQQDELIQKLQANMIQESTEEATSLHVEDASNLPAVLSVRGNHYQEVKNSINELHLIDTPETNLNNGLSYKIEDETIILNGSVESTYALVITTQSNIVDLVKAGEEWTLSAYGENMPAENTFVRITTASNANVLQALLNSTIEEGSNSTTFTENSATVRIMLAANAVYNNSKIKIKLEKGGTKTDYDKYCKMPSIYIPSEIETVGNNINIFNKNLPLIPGYLTTDGSLIESNLTSHTKSYTPVKANTQYTLSGLVKGTTSSIFRIYFWDKDKNWISKSDTNIESETYTFTTPEGTAFIDYQINNATYNPNKDKIKLEKGNKATSYSLYNQGSVKIIKNNSNIMPILNLGTNWEYTKNGIKNLAGNIGKNITKFNLKKGQTIKINFKLFSKPDKDTSFTTYVDGIEKRDIIFAQFDKYILNKIYTRTYTATEDCIVNITLWGNSNSSLFEFQLWANIDKVEDYIQYDNKEYVLNIQKEMLEGDYFDLENNKEIHNWNKVTLNGTENININANTDDYTEFKINNVLPYNSKSGYNTTYSTHFNYTTNNRSLSYNKDLLIRIPKTTNLTTVELFKTWLQENNVNVYYQLAEAIELDLTEEQKQVLNQLNNLELFKGVNNIYTEQDLALLQLDYTADTKMYIDNKILSQNKEILNVAGGN